MSEGARRQGGAEEDLAAQSRSILSSLHAAMVNARLYPTSSEIVEDSERRARAEMEQALSAWEAITFSEQEGKLLVNGLLLDERYQSRPSTVAFLKDLGLWGMRGITFARGLSGDELRAFMGVFGGRRGGGNQGRELGALLAERGVTHIEAHGGAPALADERRDDAAAPPRGADTGVDSVVGEIRATGSLHAMEGLSEAEVAAVAARLLDIGEAQAADRIMGVALRNLVSDRPDFRLRACAALKQLYLQLKGGSHRGEIIERVSELPALLLGEYNPGVRAALLDLLGLALSDLFAAGKRAAFIRSCEALLQEVELETQEGSGRAAAEALASLDVWEVGRPLTDSLFMRDEEMRQLAVRVLPFMDEVLTVGEVVARLKGEEDMEVTPELAAMCSPLQGELLADVSLILEGNAREQVYFRALSLLELLGGPAAMALVRSVERNPIPSVRARGLRTLSKMSPSDPGLLPHLLRAQGDEDPEVRREAARGLGGIGDPRSVETLLDIVRGKGPAGGEEHPRVEEAACLALARLGAEEAIPLLSELLRKKAFSLRRRAVDPRTRAAACYALGEVGGAEAVSLIREYLDDPDLVLRNEARKALAALRRRGYE